MHKIYQNFINCKGKQNKDIRYEKQIYIKEPSMINGLHVFQYLVSHGFKT